MMKCVAAIGWRGSVLHPCVIQHATAGPGRAALLVPSVKPCQMGVSAAVLLTCLF